jgi:hypothetical protein
MPRAASGPPAKLFIISVSLNLSWVYVTKVAIFGFDLSYLYPGDFFCCINGLLAIFSKGRLIEIKFPGICFAEYFYGGPGGVYTAENRCR